MLGLGLNLWRRTQTLQGKFIALIRSFGTSAHVYLPGIDGTAGLTAGNYLLPDGTTGFATVDATVGDVLDAASLRINPVVGDFGVVSSFDNTITAVTPTSFSAVAGTTATRTYVNLATVVGQCYTLECTLTSLSAGTLAVFARLGSAGGGGTLATSASIGAGALVALSFIATTTTSSFMWVSSLSATNFSVANIKLTQGITASQATAGSRPTLRRGAVNLSPRSVYAGAAGGPGTMPTGCNVVGAQGANPVAISAETPINSASQVVMLRRIGASGLEGLSVSLSSVVINIPHTESVYVRIPTGVTAADLVVYAGSGVPSPVTLVTAATLNAQAKDVWVRYSIGITYTTIPSVIGLALNTAAVGTGCDITCPQIEVGSTASAYSPTTAAIASNPSAGTYGLEFDGGDFLSAPSMPFTATGDFVAVIGARVDSTAVGAVWSLGSSSTSNPYVQAVISSAAFSVTGRADDGATTFASATAAGVQSAVNVLTVQGVTGSGLRVRMNSGAWTAFIAVPTPITLNQFAVGALYRQAAGSNFITGRVGEGVFINGVVAAADLLTIERSCAANMLNGPVF